MDIVDSLGVKLNIGDKVVYTYYHSSNYNEILCVGEIYSIDFINDRPIITIKNYCVTYDMEAEINKPKVNSIIKFRPIFKDTKYVVLKTIKINSEELMRTIMLNKLENE